jgi:protocatechuate 4,5-dioxygenase alpha chain
MTEIPQTPLLDRQNAIKGYKLNKMAMALSTPEGRASFLADEATFLDKYGLDLETKQAVLDRDWQRMVALGGNLFYILKISAVDPHVITAIGAAQAGMTHQDFLSQRLGKK